MQSIEDLERRIGVCETAIVSLLNMHEEDSKLIREGIQEIKEGVNSCVQEAIDALDEISNKTRHDMGNTKT